MSADQVKSIIDRVQRLQEEKRTIEDDIKEVYAEARANGYDVKVLRAVVKHLGKDMDEVAEFDAIFDLYLQSYLQADKPSRAHVARDAGARENTEHQPVRSSAERDPQSAQHGSDSVGGAGGESPVTVAESGQESANDGQARDEPGSAAPASGGEGGQPLPETPARKPFVLRPHCQRPEMCGSYGAKHCAECEHAAKASDDDVEDAIPAFVRKTHHHTMGEQA